MLKTLKEKQTNPQTPVETSPLSLYLIYRIIGQKINKDTDDQNSIINQPDLTDICRIHQITQNIYSSQVHQDRPSSGHQTTLNNFKRTEQI